MPSSVSASHAHVHVPKADRPLNPAQQARAADPTAKGAAFGALVSSIAKAKHDPVTPPVVEPPPSVVTEPTTTSEITPPVDITA